MNESTGQFGKRNGGEEQEAIREAISAICRRFGDDYWLKRDREGGFPEDFYAAFAADGWLGICIPEAYGGSGSASPKPRS